MVKHWKNYPPTNISRRRDEQQRRSKETNKGQNWQSTRINTRKLIRNRKKIIQRNVDGGHTGTSGNYNHTNNRIWVRIIGTKKQWNDINRSNIHKALKLSYNSQTTSQQPSYRWSRDIYQLKYSLKSMHANGVMHANRVLTKDKSSLIQITTKGKNCEQKEWGKLHEKYGIRDENPYRKWEKNIGKFIYNNNRDNFEEYIWYKKRRSKTFRLASQPHFISLHIKQLGPDPFYKTLVQVETLAGHMGGVI